VPVLSESGPLPSGVTFSQANRNLSGTAAADASGVYPIILILSNPSGVVEQNFNLTVVGPIGTFPPVFCWIACQRTIQHDAVFPESRSKPSGRLRAGRRC
jgi:hypothetical protein